LLLGNGGSLGLFYRRLSDRSLRRYAVFADYFNLGFIFLFFLSALAAALSDPGLAGARNYILALLTCGGSPAADLVRPGLAGGTTIVLASLLIAYIPLTHMSHMFMKYFLYHQVKWDDAPNRPGSRLEAAIERNLDLRPTWGANHVGADGQKTWRQIASSASKEMK
jgi:nitrate reductase gamma subunit